MLTCLLVPYVAPAAQALQAPKAAMSAELMYFLGIIAWRHYDRSNWATDAVLGEKDSGLKSNFLSIHKTRASSFPFSGSGGGEIEKSTRYVLHQGKNWPHTR